MVTKQVKIGTMGPFEFDSADEDDDFAARRGDIPALAGGVTTGFQVVSDMRDNAGTHEMKTRTLTFTDGVLTTLGAESAWTPI